MTVTRRDHGSGGVGSEIRRERTQPANAVVTPPRVHLDTCGGWYGNPPKMDERFCTCKNEKAVVK